MEYEVIKDITDEQYKRILKEFGRSFNRDLIHVVYANGKEIGFFTTYFIDNKLTIEYYLFKEYLHLGFGETLVSLASDTIGSEYPDCHRLYLLIYKENVPSQKVAKKNGYRLASDDYEFMMMIDENMPEYYTYSKENVYYNKKVKRKIKKSEI